jgi:4-diphosphocytidyl-2-C-methyl-D-erythritol kinase
MDKIVVKSPAKINIGLNIINKRRDGFHNLETIFYPIGIYDELKFTKSDHFSFDSNDGNLNSGKSNLIIKAKEEIEKYSNLKLPVKIYLQKNIPIGAGLGGGSSNAASTLITLNKLFNLNIDEKHLFELALKLGSDVPYFLNPVAAFAKSRGEVIFPIDLKLKKYLLIVNPGIHIATKWAFGLITPTQPKISLKSLVSKPRIEIEDLISVASNNFEKIVFTHFPQVKELKEKMLESGCIFSMMTGTGSTVWGMFDDAEVAYQTGLFFKQKKYFTYIQPPI